MPRDSVVIAPRTLVECEQVIEHGLATFVEVGQALLEIRERRLYKDTYSRFEDYCQERWGWSKAHANRQIEAAQVANNLTPMGVKLLSSERQARELAPLMHQDETAAVETWRELQAQYGERVTAAKIKDAVQKRIRQEIAREREPEPAITPPMPTGRYRCIVIDPPWPMQKIEREERPDQGIALDYPTMSLEEIAMLPIASLAEPSGCHIYLWFTHKYLGYALGLFDGWAVDYQCLLTWVKPVGMTPYSWMYNTEHVMFGHVGSLRLSVLGIKLSFEAPTTGHSRKPEIFYDLVRRASPGPRLEMFARQSREGFVTWGDEA